MRRSVARMFDGFDAFEQLIGSIAALGGNVGNHSLLNGGKSVRFLQADDDPQRMQGGRETVAVNDVNDATVKESRAVQSLLTFNTTLMSPTQRTASLLHKK